MQVYPSQIERICARCGKTFFVIPSKIKERRGTYCSMACRHPYATPKERLWASVNKEGPVPAHCPEFGPCWLWTGGKLKTGYGALRIKGCPKPDGASWKPSYFTVRTHRLAWLFTYGEIPVDLCVLHRCDVRLCCNPAHLFLGTYLDNHADMVAKGRDRNGSEKRRGSKSNMAKLTEPQVLEIRAAYATFSGYGACQALANQYGVSRRSIYQIVRRIVWTHV